MRWILFILVVIYFLIIIINKYSNKENYSYKNDIDVDYNPNYSKREIDYDTKYIALKRAEHKCEKCGSKDMLHVHHKLPVKFGGTDELSNLKVLCCNCHEKLHGHSFDRDRSTNTKPANKKAEIIKAAMELEKNIRFEYCNYKGEKSSRIISQINIPTDNNDYKKENRVYIEGYCMLRKEKRTFRLSRMDNIEIV